ncbi:24455_t:CDS:2, partial [Dentiscutata erythropus]
ILGGTTCVLQPPEVSVNNPFKNRITQRWKKWMGKGKASGLMLNPDGSEDFKMSSRLQAIIANYMDEVIFDEEEQSNESENLGSESSPDKLDEDVLDNDFKNMIDTDFENISIGFEDTINIDD